MHNKDVYEETLKSAIASVEIEGYKFDEMQKKDCLDFVSGKISKEEFIKLMLEKRNL